MDLFHLLPAFLSFTFSHFSHIHLSPPFFSLFSPQFFSPQLLLHSLHHRVVVNVQFVDVQ